MSQKGRSYLAIPGPSIIPERVLNAMHRPSPDIYKGELHELTASLIPDLQTVAQTEAKVAIYIANGHGAWEAAIANTLSPGDEVLTLATGRFAFGWAEIAEKLGIKITVLDFGKSSGVNLEKVEKILTKDTSNKFKAILIAHTDTSTSIRTDLKELRMCINKVGHKAMVFADCIASLGTDCFKMDDWGVDLMISACQKGLMTPPGLSFVWYNAKAQFARSQKTIVSSYWDWIPRTEVKRYYQYFCGTAPTHHLYGLRTALDMLVKEQGISDVWTKHENLSKAIWAAFDCWSTQGSIEMNVKDINLRSHAVTAASISNGGAKKLQDWCEENSDLTLGIGLGMADQEDPKIHDFFRIGHMGHINATMILGVISTIDVALKALKIPHGQYALEAATDTLARTYK